MDYREKDTNGSIPAADSPSCKEKTNTKFDTLTLKYTPQERMTRRIRKSKKMNLELKPFVVPSEYVVYSPGRGTVYWVVFTELFKRDLEMEMEKAMITKNLRLVEVMFI